MLNWALYIYNLQLFLMIDFATDSFNIFLYLIVHLVGGEIVWCDHPFIPLSYARGHFDTRRWSLSY